MLSQGGLREPCSSFGGPWGGREALCETRGAFQQGVTACSVLTEPNPCTNLSPASLSYPGASPHCVCLYHSRCFSPKRPPAANTRWGGEGAHPTAIPLHWSIPMRSLAVWPGRRGVSRSRELSAPGTLLSVQIPWQPIRSSSRLPAGALDRRPDTGVNKHGSSATKVDVGGMKPGIGSPGSLLFDGCSWSAGPERAPGHGGAGNPPERYALKASVPLFHIAASPADVLCHPGPRRPLGNTTANPSHRAAAPGGSDPQIHPQEPSSISGSREAALWGL